LLSFIEISLPSKIFLRTFFAFFTKNRLDARKMIVKMIVEIIENFYGLIVFAFGSGVGLSFFPNTET
jgi:hypothetical protein